MAIEFKEFPNKRAEAVEALKRFIVSELEAAGVESEHPVWIFDERPDPDMIRHDLSAVGANYTVGSEPRAARVLFDRAIPSYGKIDDERYKIIGPIRELSEREKYIQQLSPFMAADKGA